MLILGIETATHQVGCAIGGHEGVMALYESARDRRHAETLVPAIQFVMRQARIGLDEIGAVAVDVGPGLFTGLRVGVAAAKAIAQRAAGADDRGFRASICSPSQCGTRAARSSRDRRSAGRAVLRLLPSRCRAACSG